MNYLTKKEYPLVINSYPCINNWINAPSLPLRELRYQYLLGQVIDVKKSHLLEISINTHQGTFRMIATLNNIFSCCYISDNYTTDYLATGSIKEVYEYLKYSVNHKRCIVKIHGFTKSGIPFIELLIPKDEYYEEFMKYFPKNIEGDNQLSNSTQMINNNNNTEQMVHITLSRSLFINVGNHIINTFVDPEHRSQYHNKGRMINKRRKSTLFNHRVWKKKEVIIEDEQDKNLNDGFINNQ